MASFFPLLVSLLATTTLVVVKSEPNLGYISSFCGLQSDINPPQMRNRALQATSLAMEYASPGVEATCASIEIRPIMYASAWCPIGVARSDCTACLEFAKSQLLDNLCKDTYGAQLELVGCFLRYETYNFCKG